MYFNKKKSFKYFKLTKNYFQSCFIQLIISFLIDKFDNRKFYAPKKLRVSKWQHCLPNFG